MADELDFTFELTPLADEEPFNLSDAMQFLGYGGILRFRLTGSDQPSQIDHGFLSRAKDGHLRLRLPDSDVVLNGPHVLDLAKAGSLFSLSKDAAPDPETRKAADVRLRNRRNSYETAKIKFAEAKVRYEQAVDAHRQWQVHKDEHAQQIAAWEASGKVGPKPECEKEPAIPNAPLEPTPPGEFDTSSLPTTWQAEMERRETELQIRLNEAARSGKLRMWGVQVNEPLCDEQSPYRPPEEPEEIPSKYFYFGIKASEQSARNRYFDSETNRIHAVPLHLPEVADREICLYADNPSTDIRFRSYSNVTMEREGLLALAAELSPDLAYTERDAPETVAARVATPKKRGPRFQYDWGSFDRQLQLVLEDEGAIDPKIDPGPKGFIQARLEETMTGWCEANWRRAPSESSIRDRVSAFLAKAGN